MVRELIWDGLLVAGFGVQHSLFAMIRAKKVVRRVATLDPLAWRGVQSLLNVLYVLVAACLWVPVDVVLWELQGAAAAACWALLAAGWLWYFQIHLFEYDTGLAFGSTAVINRAVGRPSPAMAMWKVGTRRWIRFPVHTAFFPMFLAFPRMTASLLVFGVVANLYNYVGTVLYDRRLETLVGEPYFRYQSLTGLILPPLLRRPGGAAPMEMPRPRMWAEPSRNLEGIALGLAGGALYWTLLGAAEAVPAQIFSAWGASWLLAALGGAALGALKLRRMEQLRDGEHDLLQVELAVNAALMSAVALVAWFAAGLGTTGQAPTLAVVLPMWTTTLWAGHTAAYATAHLLARPAAAGVAAAQGGD